MLTLSRRTLLGLLAACLTTGALAAAAQESPRVVILGLPTEVKDIEAQLARPTVERVQGVSFSVGAIGSRRVILGKTNAGTVNAAMMAALAIAPSAVFFSGTAGALDPRDELRQVLTVVMRSISDTADGGTPDADLTNIDVASRNAATLTLAVISDLAK
jgi:nucleoside phosphorylase